MYNEELLNNILYSHLQDIDLAIDHLMKAIILSSQEHLEQSGDLDNDVQIEEKVSEFAVGRLLLYKQLADEASKS